VPDLEGLPRELLIAEAMRLRVDNVEMRAENGRLREENAELRARVDRLERLMSRNSRNSSMPPSTDDLPGKKPPPDEPGRRGRGGPKRKRGKQPGARGAHLPWREDPDETLPRYPGGSCECGADLAGAEDLGVARSHQQYEIPRPRAVLTQHDRHAVRCGCGRVHVAERPAGLADAAVSYGPTLQSWCVFLMVVHAIPVHRCAQLIASLTGTTPSVGFVHGMLARAAAALVEVDQRIRTLITLARAVCCDETPIRVGPRKAKRYLLVAATGLYTWYLLGDRSLATFKELGLAELRGVVVHDRYQNYDSPEVGELIHQLCAAHLLRDLDDAAECYPTAHWPAQIADALRGLIHAANTARDNGLDAVPARIARPLIRRYRDGVAVGLSEIRPAPAANAKQPPGRPLLECLRDREPDVLRFLTDLEIPPTNNQAERDVRPAKTQQKISGRLQSEQTTKHRYRIAGYVATAAKHGVDQLTAIRDALLGTPWMPPDPAPT
jgi:transposase